MAVSAAVVERILFLHCYESIPQLQDMCFHVYITACGQHPEDVCVKWCRVKNPLPTIKLSFIFACFSPCPLISGTQFPTVTRFLFLCSPFLVYSLFCKSVIGIMSIFKMTHFFFLLYLTYIYITTKVPKYFKPGLMQIHNWLHCCKTFAVLFR